MGNVAEAVLEFDEAVAVPWRPPLTTAPRPVGPSGASVLAMPATRRPRAARVSRLTVPPPLPVVEIVPARSDEPSVRPAGRVPGGSTASGHSCVACATGRRTGPAVRLTRRARLLIAVLATAVAVVLGVWIGSLVGGGDELVLVSDSSVVVQPGDTLWSIARSVADDQDVRAVVDAIQELNDLPGSDLQPGQVLRLP